jgi:hypothetical protein
VRSLTGLWARTQCEIIIVAKHRDVFEPRIAEHREVIVVDGGACYGTLAATVLLSLAGITLVLNPALWAGTVVTLGALATIAVAAGSRRHRSYAALGFVLAGSMALAYVQFADYSVSLELIAFGLLAVGVALDFLRRRKNERERAFSPPKEWARPDRTESQ